MPNISIEIIDNQFWLRTSINISSDLIKYLPKGNVFKSKKMYIFVISARILGQISEEKINIAYSNCIKTAMSKVRESKILKIKNELISIPHLQYKLFN